MGGEKTFTVFHTWWFRIRFWQRSPALRFWWAGRGRQIQCDPPFRVQVPDLCSSSPSRPSQIPQSTLAPSDTPPHLETPAWGPYPFLIIINRNSKFAILRSKVNPPLNCLFHFSHHPFPTTCVTGVLQQSPNSLPFLFLSVSQVTPRSYLINLLRKLF